MQTAPFFAEKFALNQGFETYRLKAWTVDQELRLAADWASAHREESLVPLRPSLRRALRLRDPPVRGERRHPRDGGGEVRRRRLRLRRRESAPAGGSWRSTTAPCSASTAKREIARWLYDRGVETLDRQLGRFFDDLRRAGLWDETLVVVTGDHGEAFGEHGYFLHTTPHEETLRVPLLVKWPASSRRSGLQTTRFSTALDLAPTILAHFGLPADDLPGHDLAQAAGWRGPRRPAHDLEGRRAARRPEARLRHPRVPARALRPGGRSGGADEPPAGARGRRRAARGGPPAGHRRGGAEGGDLRARPTPSRSPSPRKRSSGCGRWGTCRGCRESVGGRRWYRRVPSARSGPQSIGFSF